MTQDEKMAAFEAMAHHLIEQTKRYIDFSIIVLKDRGYRMHLKLGKKSEGWAAPLNMTMKEFEKNMIQHIENLIK